jgi:hypothetical protein
MGQTAENLALRYDISRRESDEFALRSQQKAAASWDRRAEEIAPIEVASGKGSVVMVRDEHPRPDTTLEGLAALTPTFSAQGVVTPGNASGITDGAAALVLMSESRARAEGRQSLARIVAAASAGVDPAYMGIGVVPATRKVLERTGLSLQDFDVIELNEAFAAQVLACDRELKLDHDKLNPNGGAVALGHPIGMTGARIVLTCADVIPAKGHALPSLRGNQPVVLTELGRREPVNVLLDGGSERPCLSGTRAGPGPGDGSSRSHDTHLPASRSLDHAHRVRAHVFGGRRSLPFPAIGVRRHRAAFLAAPSRSNCSWSGSITVAFSMTNAGSYPATRSRVAWRAVPAISAASSASTRLAV